jgi:hypothetical protein
VNPEWQAKQLQAHRESTQEVKQQVLEIQRQRRTGVGIRGRESQFSQEIADTICDRMAAGETLRDIVKDPSMPCNKTVFYWLTRRPDFADQYARARAQLLDYWADEMIEISDDGSNDWMEKRIGKDVVSVLDHEHVLRSKIRVETRRWLMSRLAPHKYGDKTLTEHSGGVTVEIVKFSRED